MDGRVLDVNWLVRFCIVHFAILPSRPNNRPRPITRSGRRKARRWWSPAATCRRSSRQRLSVPVELAMRYQNPSIPQAVRSLAQQGRGRSAADSAVPALRDVELRNGGGAGEGSGRGARAADARAGAAAVLRATRTTSRRWSASAQEYPPAGLRPSAVQLPRPARAAPAQVRSHRAPLPGDGRTAARRPARPTPPATGRSVSRPWPPSSSRPACRRANTPSPSSPGSGAIPGSSPTPTTSFRGWRSSGVKKLLVICPAFVSDCLETLEEIGMRGRETFLEAGGTDFALIPCLNEHPLWLEALERMVRRFLAPEQNQVGQTAVEAAGPVK